MNRPAIHTAIDATQPDCAASVVVNFYNLARGKKLPSWWRAEEVA